MINPVIVGLQCYICLLFVFFSTNWCNSFSGGRSWRFDY